MHKAKIQTIKNEFITSSLDRPGCTLIYNIGYDCYD
jgi:hypothetical protein